MDFDLLELDRPEIVEDTFKITIDYEGKETTVSWYKGTDSKDIEDAILCACDSIIDQGFTLNDSDGFPVSIGSILPGGKYYIIPGKEIIGKESIIGNRFRRLTVEINPLKHLESLRAIEYMKTGSNLLKHTKNSMPHIRLFQITEDLKFIIWYSSSKTQEKSSVFIQNISSLEIGQKTETFLDYPIPSLEHLSFSVVHSGGTLDITCRDEKEFDLWLIGLKALVFHFKDIQVSKQVLLSHSRRFNEYLKSNKIGGATQVIYKEAESKRLEDCVARKKLSPEEIGKKLNKVHFKMTGIAEKILDIPNDFLDYDLGKQSMDAFGGEYIELGIEDFANDEIFHCEKQRLVDLNQQCRAKLILMETEFSAKNFEGKNTSEFETELWRLEVDVENLNDIVNRVIKVTGEKWGKRLKSWLGDLF